jgi:hypothetical protein
VARRHFVGWPERFLLILLLLPPFFFCGCYNVRFSALLTAPPSQRPSSAIFLFSDPLFHPTHFSYKSAKEIHPSFSQWIGRGESAKEEQKMSGRTSPGCLTKYKWRASYRNLVVFFPDRQIQNQKKQTSENC